MLIIENVSGVNLDIDDLGLSIEPNATVDLTLESSSRDVAASGVVGGGLYDFISSGNIVVKDPSNITINLSIQEGISAIRTHNDTHYRMPPGGRIADAIDVDLSSPGTFLKFDGDTFTRQTPEEVASDIESSINIENVEGGHNAWEIIDADGTTNIKVDNNIAVNLPIITYEVNGTQVARMFEGSTEFLTYVDMIVGSETEPAIRFGDSNTGLFAAGANTLDFATNGSRVAQFSTNGLSLYSSLESATPAIVFINDSAAGNAASIRQSDGGLQLTGTGGAQDQLLLVDGPTMDVIFGGYPNTRSDGDTPDTVLYTNVDGRLQAGNLNRVKTTGDVMTGPLQFIDGDENNLAFNFTNRTDSGFYATAFGNIFASVRGETVASFRTNGMQLFSSDESDSSPTLVFSNSSTGANDDQTRNASITFVEGALDLSANIDNNGQLVLLADDTTKEIRLGGYFDTRDDGPTKNALYTDDTGLIQHGPIGLELEDLTNTDLTITDPDARTLGVDSNGNVVYRDSIGTPPPTVNVGLKYTQYDEQPTNGLYAEILSIVNNTGSVVTATGTVDAVGDVTGGVGLTDNNKTNGWTGGFYLDTPTTLSLSTTSDDFSFIVIDGSVVVDNGGFHGDETETGNVTLTKGWHSIAAYYGNAGGGGVFSFTGLDGLLFVPEFEQPQSDVQTVLSALDLLLWRDSFTHKLSDGPLINNDAANVFYDALTLVSNIPADGQYLISIDYTWSYNIATADFISRTLVDGVKVLKHRQEPKDVGGGADVSGGQPTLHGTTATIGTNQMYGYSQSQIVTLTAGSHSVVVEIGSDAGGNEATIHCGEIRIQRWTA